MNKYRLNGAGSGARPPDSWYFASHCERPLDASVRQRTIVYGAVSSNDRLMRCPFAPEQAVSFLHFRVSIGHLMIHSLGNSIPKRANETMRARRGKFPFSEGFTRDPMSHRVPLLE